VACQPTDIDAVITDQKVRQSFHTLLDGWDIELIMARPVVAR